MASIAAANKASSNSEQRVSLTLRVDYPQDCLAGTNLSGRVYVELPPTAAAAAASSSFPWQGIHVRLEGYEYAAVLTAGGKVVQQQDPLILTEQPIVTWSSAKDAPTGSPRPHHHQLEYPFRWSLPANLPASMYCCRGGATTNNNNSKEHCRIDYTLSAFFVSRVGGEKMHPSNVVSLQVRSHAVTAAARGAGQAVRLAAEKFPIVTALVFDKGHVEMGVELSTDTLLHPGGHVRVGVSGVNRSQVAVKDFVIRLIERVTWSAGNDRNKRRTDETVLAQDKIWTHGAVDWQSRAKRQNDRLRERQTLWNLLRVPEQRRAACRNTYRGTLLRVEHVVRIVAETAVDQTTNPRRYVPVRLVNASRADHFLQRQQQHALVLPAADWRPVVAAVTEIPDTLVVPPLARARIVDNSSQQEDGTTALSRVSNNQEEEEKEEQDVPPNTTTTITGTSENGEMEEIQNT